LIEPNKPHPTLILGIGNVLMGDEGIGVHVVRSIERRGAPSGADVIDGGTGGFQLLEYFKAYRRILLVDATLDGQPPGTLTILRPQFSSDYPPTLTAHDIGLKDLLDAAQLLGHQPEIVLFALSVASVEGPSLELSKEIEASIPATIRAMDDMLTGLSGRSGW
jgi:hydrogenase maturation protease